MSRGLLERVNVYFEDAGCKTDPTGLSKLASAGASVAVKAGAVASALVFGEILTPEDIFRLLSLEQVLFTSDAGALRHLRVISSTIWAAAEGRWCLQRPSVRSRRNVLASNSWSRGTRRHWLPKPMLLKTYKGHLEDACKVYLCNAAFPRHLNAAFAAALDPQRAPALEALVTCAALPEESLHQARLQLTQVAECSATWATQGAPLFLYKRGGDGIRSAGGATAIPANVRYEASRQLSAATQSAGLSHEDERMTR
eukprot:s4196_g2.t3